MPGQKRKVEDECTKANTISNGKGKSQHGNASLPGGINMEGGVDPWTGLEMCNQGNCCLKGLNLYWNSLWLWTLAAGYYRAREILLIEEPTFIQVRRRVCIQQLGDGIAEFCDRATYEDPYSMASTMATAEFAITWSDIGCCDLIAKENPWVEMQSWIREGDGYWAPSFFPTLPSWNVMSCKMHFKRTWTKWYFPCICTIRLVPGTRMHIFHYCPEMKIRSVSIHYRPRSASIWLGSMATAWIFAIRSEGNDVFHARITPQRLKYCAYVTVESVRRSQIDINGVLVGIVHTTFAQIARHGIRVDVRSKHASWR